MVKIIDYPRASLRAALQLAGAVAKFAGSCSMELAAEQLGKKLSGAFTAQVSATSKYGLIENKGGRLTVTQLYRNFQLAYTEAESAKYLRQALLSPPLFRDIYERFRTQQLPVAHFEKMLIREFHVSPDMSSRVAGYFLDGAKQAGLLNGEHVLVAEDHVANEDGLISDNVTVDSQSDSQSMKDAGASVAPFPAAEINAKAPTSVSTQVGSEFSLSIQGPGTNFSLEIRDSDDLEIVRVMLRKIEKALNATIS